jgi:hypothetical protein
MFLLWEGEYYYLSICRVIKTFDFYLLSVDKCERLRLENILCPRFPH